MQFYKPRRFKLPIQSGNIRGLELLPKFQDPEKILFRRLDSCQLRCSRSGIRTVEFSVQSSDSPARTTKRGRSGSACPKTSGTTATTEYRSQFLVERRNCLGQRPCD